MEKMEFIFEDWGNINGTQNVYRVINGKKIWFCKIDLQTGDLIFPGLVLCDMFCCKVTYDVAENMVTVDNGQNWLRFDLKEFDEYFSLFDYLNDLCYGWAEEEVPIIRQKVDLIFRNRHLFCKMLREEQF